MHFHIDLNTLMPICKQDKSGTEKVTVSKVKQRALRTQSQSMAKVGRSRFGIRQRAKTIPSSSSEEDENETNNGWLVVGKEKSTSLVANERVMIL